MAEVAPLNFALGYSRHGARVFPCHYVTSDGQCSCGGEECRNDSKGRGKHPLHKGWQTEATADRQALIMLWADNPLANVGVACGKASNLTVVDVDGEVGFAQLRELESKYGALPDTPRVITGSGGCHLLFEYVPELRNAVRWAPGLDIRTEGGLIIGAGSRNAFGEYIFETGHSLKDLPRAKMPQWLIDAIKQGQGGTNGTSNGSGFKIPEEPIHQGEGRNNLLYRAARSMKARGFDAEAIRAAIEATNQTKCKPPLGKDELKALLRNADTQPNSADFKGSQSAGAESVSQSSESSIAEETPAPAYPWPEPLDEAAFHGLAGDFVKLVEPHTEADPAALLIQFLVAAGNVVGRSIYRRAEGARHFTNLFCTLIGRTGHGRKGSSWAQVQRPFYLLQDNDWIKTRKQTGLVSGEGLIWCVRDAIERKEPIKERGRYTGEYQIAQVDPGVADKRLLVMESEFAKVLIVAGREGNTLSQIIRQAYDGDDLQSLNKNSPGRATGAHISIIGHVTDEELVRNLYSTEAANGFANRHLWLCVTRSKLLPRGGYLNDEHLHPLVARLDKAIAWAKARGDVELGFSEEAWKLWDEVYPILTGGRPGLLGAMLNRAEAQVLRLSCIYAMLDSLDAVERVHLEAALAVWEYCEASVGYVFGDRLGDPDADAILAALRTHRDGLTRTEIRDIFLRNLSAARIERALATLRKENLASFEKVATNGRPAEIWKAVGRSKGSTTNG
jgi:Bifunctional DNA primase/polymerase, N-terminal/Primase C terminal 1 (PriCT-1)